MYSLMQILSQPVESSHIPQPFQHVHFNAACENLREVFQILKKVVLKANHQRISDTRVLSLMNTGEEFVGIIIIRIVARHKTYLFDYQILFFGYSSYLFYFRQIKCFASFSHLFFQQDHS